MPAKPRASTPLRSVGAGSVPRKRAMAVAGICWWRCGRGLRRPFKTLRRRRATWRRCRGSCWRSSRRSRNWTRRMGRMTLAQQLQPLTRGGLLPEARHLVLPSGIVSTGYPSTEAVCRRIGIVFDPWQADLNRCILAKSADELYAADKVARESFNELRAWARSPLLRQHIDYDDITTGAGNECIPFRNGSRVVFAARERGAIRGFTKVRRLVIDEGQILTDFALSDLAPTMYQAWNPQIIFMGTPPKL